VRDLLIGLYFLVAPLGTLAADHRNRGADLTDLPKLVLQDLGRQIPAVLVTVAAAAWLVALIPRLRGGRARTVAGWFLALTAILWLGLGILGLNSREPDRDERLLPMMPTIDSAGPALSEAELQRFERDVGHRLPEDYREFLLRHNGGRPSPDTCAIPGHLESPTDVQILFGLTRSVKTSTLAWNREMFMQENGPEDLLPIACDSFGHLFCLWTAGSKRGVVEYLDRDADPPKFYRLARSFSGFLELLHDP
jgi:hypothetical protein